MSSQVIAFITFKATGKRYAMKPALEYDPGHTPSRGCRSVDREEHCSFLRDSAICSTLGFPLCNGPTALFFTEAPRDNKE